MCVSRPKPAVQVQQEVYPAAVVVVQQQPVQEQLPRYEPGAGGSYPSGSGGGYPTPTQQQQGGYGMNPDPYK